MSSRSRTRYLGAYEFREAVVSPFHATRATGILSGSEGGGDDAWLWRVRVGDEIVMDAEGHTLFVEVDEAKAAAERVVGHTMEWREEKL